MGRAPRIAASAVGLLALAVFATWPLARHMGDFLFVGDAMVSAWDLWWVPHAVLHLNNPWFTDRLLAPDGTYLAFHALVPLAGVVMAPVTLLFGPGISYNLLKLLLPVAAALTARALGRELGLRPAAAWVAGCLYGFSTIVDWRTTFHMNFGTGLVLLPLPVLFVSRYARTKVAREALLAGLAVALTLYADPTIAFLAALAAAVYGVIALIADRELRRWLRGAALALAALLVAGLPQLAMMVRAATNGGYRANVDGLAANWAPGATNVLTMLSPGNVRTAVPGQLESLAYRHPWGEATPAYGWGVLALALCGLVAFALARFSIRPVPARVLVWGAVLALAASVLALGPVLRLGTTAHVPLAAEIHHQRLSQLMPYTWLTRLPVFADVRIPARFVMLGILPLAMLAGVGAQALWGRGRGAGSALVVALLAFALLESGFPDGGSAKQWVPMTRPAITDPIRADHSNSVVVDVPLGFLSGTAGAGASHEQEGMLRATAHDHRIAGAYVSRLAQPAVNALAAHRFYGDVMALQPPAAAGAAAPAVDPRAGAADAAAIGVGWVVVWPDASRRVLPYLRRAGFAEVRRDRGVILMRRANG